MKIFKVPDSEFHTEGLGIDYDKEKYNLNHLVVELRKDSVFKNREFDDCWKWGLDDAIIHAIKNSDSFEDAVENEQLVKMNGFFL